MTDAPSPHDAPTQADVPNHGFILGTTDTESPRVAGDVVDELAGALADRITAWARNLTDETLKLGADHLAEIVASTLSHEIRHQIQAETERRNLHGEANTATIDPSHALGTTSASEILAAGPKLGDARTAFDVKLAEILDSIELVIATDDVLAFDIEMATELYDSLAGVANSSTAEQLDSLGRSLAIIGDLGHPTIRRCWNTDILSFDQINSLHDYGWNLTERLVASDNPAVVTAAFQVRTLIARQLPSINENDKPQPLSLPDTDQASLDNLHSPTWLAQNRAAALLGMIRGVKPLDTASLEDLLSAGDDSEVLNLIRLTVKSAPALLAEQIVAESTLQACGLEVLQAITDGYSSRARKDKAPNARDRVSSLQDTVRAERNRREDPTQLLADTRRVSQRVRRAQINEELRKASEDRTPESGQRLTRPLKFKVPISDHQSLRRVVLAAGRHDYEVGVSYHSEPVIQLYVDESTMSCDDVVVFAQMAHLRGGGGCFSFDSQPSNYDTGRRDPGYEAYPEEFRFAALRGRLHPDNYSVRFRSSSSDFEKAYLDLIKTSRDTEAVEAIVRLLPTASPSLAQPIAEAYLERTRPRPSGELLQIALSVATPEPR